MLYSVSLVEIWGEGGGNRGGGRGKERKGEGGRRGRGKERKGEGEEGGRRGRGKERKGRGYGSLSGCQKLYYRGGGGKNAAVDLAL